MIKEACDKIQKELKHEAKLKRQDGLYSKIFKEFEQTSAYEMIVGGLDPTKILINHQIRDLVSHKF